MDCVGLGWYRFILAGFCDFGLKPVVLVWSRLGRVVFVWVGWLWVGFGWLVLGRVGLGFVWFRLGCAGLGWVGFRLVVLQLSGGHRIWRLCIMTTAQCRELDGILMMIVSMVMTMH